MKALTTDPDQIRREFEAIASWDDWAAFVAHYFNWDTAPERSADRIEADLERPPVACGGRVWEPYGGNYDVAPRIEFLFEDLSERIFARLAPEAHADNLRHPERYGWKCVNCRRYTREETSHCPACGQKLLRMPMNEPD